VAGPDRFALGWDDAAAGFSAAAKLYQDHPIWYRRSADQCSAGGSLAVAPAWSISVVGMELVPEVYRVVPAPDPKNNPPSLEPVEASAGNELRMVKVKLSDKAKDERKSHLFTLRQFRLAGRKPGSASMMEVHAIGIEQEQNDPTPRHIRFKKGARICRR
jgi:hypothetical protein